MYTYPVTVAVPSDHQGRWKLYRLLGDPLRLRLLALSASEELAVGELAQLLDESQPNVSRQASPLRQAGLLLDRRQGHRTMVRLSDKLASDPVVLDALAEGNRLCTEEGRLQRIPDVIAARDQHAREYFARPAIEDDEGGLGARVPLYAYVVANLGQDRELVVDAGTGAGTFLDILAPTYARVIAVDRSGVRLEQAEQRVRARGYENVELVCSEIDAFSRSWNAEPGASAVIATRLLHHAPLPRNLLTALAGMLKPGGQLAVVDYAPHDDEVLRELRADVWMGFSDTELLHLASAARLIDAKVRPIPSGYVGGGIDGHLRWQLLTARRPLEPAALQSTEVSATASSNRVIDRSRGE